MGSTLNIVHLLQINSSIESVFEVISTPRGMSKWWTSNATGHPELGALLELEFTEDIRWQAQVTQMVAPHEFEITLTRCDEDWMDSIVGFLLSKTANGVSVRFYHNGWEKANDHYYTSCYCWAMYLRLMKRYLEYGEIVPYHQRLSV